jgi:hypothetical protein
MAYRIQKSRKKNRSKRLYAAGAAALVLVVFIVLELTNTIHFFRHTPPPPTGPVTKGEVTNDTNKAPGSSSSTSSTSTTNNADSTPNTPSQKTSSATTTPAAALTAPTGLFVSAHNMSLSGSNTITSNCTTTPGATCQISFTMGGVTKYLPSKSTDSQGTAYWNNWKLQSIGLTQGTWAIQATASNGSSTQSATDPRSLVVEP